MSNLTTATVRTSAIDLSASLQNCKRILPIIELVTVSWMDASSTCGSVVG